VGCAAGGVGLAQQPAAGPTVVVPVLFQSQPVAPPTPVSAYPQAAPGGAAQAAEPARAEPPADPPLKASWKDGPVFATEDKTFVFRPGGRFQLDTVWYAAPAAVRAGLPGPVPLADGVHFRRGRFAATGTFLTTIDFNTEFDFTNVFVPQTDPLRFGNTVVPTDLWLTFRQLPVIGNLRVGNQKPPISFEHTTSSKYLNFLERSPGFDAFAENGNNGFSPGVMAFDHFLTEERGYWAVGVFKTIRTPFGFGSGRNEADLTGRVVVLPVYEDGGQRLLHVGLAASHRDLDGGLARYRARLGVRSDPGALANLAADTGLVAGSNEQRLVPELAGVFGPLSFQAEYYAAWLQDAGPAFFQGAYAEVHYFLTGEHREYDHERMAFTRVKPLRPVRWTGCDRGWGAWQVAARYSYLDLNSRAVRGGILNEFAVGVNWFLTANAKVQANYVLTDRDAAGSAADGVIHGFGIRTAWDF
jgi:phosphate-selective porin OprO/OprP